jgi:hypothetical protein
MLLGGRLMPHLPFASPSRSRAWRPSQRQHPWPGRWRSGRRGFRPHEVLAGIIGGAVAASLGRGASWPRLVQNRIRVAAVTPAEGNAMVGELFPKYDRVQSPSSILSPVRRGFWLTGCPSTRPGARCPH